MNKSIKIHKYTDIEEFTKAIKATEILELSYRIHVQSETQQVFSIAGSPFQEVRYFVLEILGKTNND